MRNAAVRDDPSQRLHEIGVLRGEKPDGSAALFMLLEKLRGHWLAVAFLDPGETQHDRAIPLQRLPEILLPIRFVCP